MLTVFNQLFSGNDTICTFLGVKTVKANNHNVANEQS